MIWEECTVYRKPPGIVCTTGSAWELPPERIPRTGHLNINSLSAHDADENDCITIILLKIFNDPQACLALFQCEKKGESGNVKRAGVNHVNSVRRATSISDGIFKMYVSWWDQAKVQIYKFRLVRLCQIPQPTKTSWECDYISFMTECLNWPFRFIWSFIFQILLLLF